ncbi:MAG: trigger factor [Gammaproteobacteria bacterium]|jgi:trigger factor|nr:trigger factor [Gammaproteobacteria bacterium]
MQVSVETGEGLERKLKVQVPAETVDAQVESRLKSMQSRVKVDGFRPGKVPFSVVKQRYSTQVFQEVAGEVMQNTFREAVTQESLRPASDPSIEPISFELGHPLEYVATFEVYPEVELAPVSELNIEKLSAEIQDKDVDNLLETLRKQKASWTEVDRPSKEGDRVTVSFKGSIDGELFEGGSAENVPLVLGSGSMIPGFEEQFVGLAKGEDSTVKITFPEDYSASELAGKPAEFAVSASKVEAPELPALDDAFAKEFGVEEGGMEKLREDVRNNMQRELDNRISLDLKTKVMDKLLEANPIEVPKAIVQEEAEALKKQASAQQTAEPSAEALASEAERRVKLGMILGDLVKTSELKVDRAKVDERIETMAKDYEQPDEFVNYYKSNPQLLQGVESMVVEDMVVDWVVDQAKISTVKSSFDEIMKPTSTT